MKQCKKKQMNYTILLIQTRMHVNDIVYWKKTLKENGNDKYTRKLQEQTITDEQTQYSK